MSGAILDLAVAIPQHYIELKDLAKQRGIDPDKYLLGLGASEMSICGPGEDTVSLAANATERLLSRYPYQKKDIGLCIVGTETGVDGSKSIAAYLHGLLSLPSSCRVFEIKQACYAGTAALRMATAWTAQNPKKYALVISSDIARYDLYSPGEPTQGGGAVAMLVGQSSEEKSILSISEVSGVYTNDVNDFWRPNYQSTALVRGKFSVDCYLEGLKGAYQDYISQIREEEEPQHLLFHVPFPNMARKAHRRLMELKGHSMKDWLAKDFKTRVSPALWANRQVGNIYTGSLYLALAGLLENAQESLSGQTIGIFSYGSGSCSEYFTGELGQNPYTPHLQQLLLQRTRLSIPDYEDLREQNLKMESNSSYREDLSGHGQAFTFLGMNNHERIYRKNAEYFETSNKLRERTVNTDPHSVRAG